MQRIVILTGSELRHDFVRQAIALDEEIEVVRSFCEGLTGTALDRARRQGSTIQIQHLERRARIERDFFQHFVELTRDESAPEVIERGTINDKSRYRRIKEMNPDLLAAYGCSILRNPLLSEYEDKILNVHLGLSPYYRGTGTNFWPLVNGEPEYVGATFMLLDEGVDTGPILHQQRAEILPEDTPHRIGNRLIADMVDTYREIIRKFPHIEPVDDPPSPAETKYYEQDDFSDEATRRLYQRFDNGMIEAYLEDRAARESAVPIAENPLLGSD